MKYEKLNKIEVSRKIWPAGKTVKLDAYEAQVADEAIEEIVNWYKSNKEELDNLRISTAEKITELNAKIDELTNLTKEKDAQIKELNETVSEYKIQTSKMETELNDKNALIKDQSETILRINVNTSHGLDEISKLNEKVNELQSTVDEKNKQIDIYKHNIEEERLAVKVLNEKNQKLEEKFTYLNNTLEKISALTEFYKNYEKGNS